jgi:glucoamylase
VGTALTARSQVWFTLSHGILNEIYYPRIDHACTRGLRLHRHRRQSFFSEEKRAATSTSGRSRKACRPSPHQQLRRTDATGIEKRVLAIRVGTSSCSSVEFHALAGEAADYHLYALLAPHLVNRGAGNTAWIDDYKGTPMLFAEGSGTALAVGCSTRSSRAAAGFVGVSDGWQDLSRNFELRWHYDHARDGNVALTGEIDLSACGGGFDLALGIRTQRRGSRAPRAREPQRRRR